MEQAAPANKLKDESIPVGALSLAWLGLHLLVFSALRPIPRPGLAGGAATLGDDPDAGRGADSFAGNGADLAAVAPDRQAGGRGKYPAGITGKETTMPAYVVVDIEVTDPVVYDEYRRLARPGLQLTGANTWRAPGRR